MILFLVLYWCEIFFFCHCGAKRRFGVFENKMLGKCLDPMAKKYTVGHETHNDFVI